MRSPLHWLLSVCLTLLISAPLPAQEGGQVAPVEVTASKKQGAEKKPAKKSGEPTFEEAVKDFEKIPGLFTVYWKKDEGKVYLEIRPDQLGTVYLCNITRQTGDGLLFDAGAMLGEFPFYFQRVGKKVLWIHKNVYFRAAPDAAIRRAVEHSLTNSVMGSAKIVSQPHPETGALLVDASSLFVQDMHLVSYLTEQANMAYAFDKSASFFSQIKSFPQNTEIEVTLHFKSKRPTPIFTLPDSRSMLHRYHFSLSTLPETDYHPREADDRVGHFLTMYQDYTSLLQESPYTRYITRWQLEKAEPRFKVSPPRKPIVFWIENTVPVEYRDAIREGILKWNRAFERIGFKDAIQVRQMPDDADWDPADVRYNVIRWIVTPGAGYAVGPSRANPFNGQIYDADVRISADFLRFYYREFDEFVTPLHWTAARDLQHWPEWEWTGGTDQSGFPLRCTYSSGLMHQMGFGWSLLVARGLVEDDPENLKQFIHDGLVDLVLHEVGHTLGLRHNFKASSVVPPEKLLDPQFTRRKGISGSVMDYNPVNLAPEGKPQGSYFQTEPGPYDYWAIEYAYRPLEPGSKQSEKEMLEKIASRVADPKLQYATDEDAFGLSTRGVDPTVSPYDLSSDPLAYYQQRISMARELWEKIPEKFEKKGARYQKFRLVFSQGLGEYLLAALTIPRYVGGLYMHRDHIGDPGGRPPFEVVPAEKQRAALKFVIDRLFAEDAFQFSPDLLNKLAPERFWDFEGTVFRMLRLDYPIHGIVQVIQAAALYRLYDFLVLQRVQDNELRFAKGEKTFTMAELFTTLREAIWSELKQPRNVNSFRRELQRMHLSILVDMLVGESPLLPHDAITLARADLVAIKQQAQAALQQEGLDAYTRAHLEETVARIDAALSAQMVRER
ncbi:MAG: DUF5117 domain-containing protein [Calditrichaeota bacterium]|nr:MAG: DUF5117 domain-containing protein [Calditrichota bacterium]